MRLWDYDQPVSEADIEVPAFIDQDITGRTVAAIKQGGCSSGAYMPAVRYFDANKTMAEHGNDVLQYIEDHRGELPQVPRGESWSGIAVLFLSTAVETWADTVPDDLDDDDDDDPWNYDDDDEPEPEPEPAERTVELTGAERDAYIKARFGGGE